MSTPDIDLYYKCNSISEAKRAILEQLGPVLPSLRNIPGYAGLVVFGSTVEKKLSRKPKDMDLLVLVSSEFSGMGRITVGELVLELFIRPINLLLQTVIADRSLFDVRNIAPGILLEWTDPLAPLIKKAAEVAWKDGPPRASTLEIMWMKERYFEVLKAASQSRCAAHSSVEDIIFVQQAVDDFHRLHGIYLTKWTYLLPRMSELDTSFYQAGKAILMCTNDVRDKGIVGLSSRMLEFLGGPPPREWYVESVKHYCEIGDGIPLNLSYCNGFKNIEVDFPSKLDWRVKDLSSIPPAVTDRISESNIHIVLQSLIPGTHKRHYIFITDDSDKYLEGVCSVEGERVYFTQLNKAMALQFFCGTHGDGIDIRLPNATVLSPPTPISELLMGICTEAMSKGGGEEFINLRNGIVIRCELESILSQVQELESSGRVTDARYVTGVLLRRCLQTWLEIKRLFSPDDHLDTLKYVASCDSRVASSIRQLNNFLAGQIHSKNMSEICEGLIDIILNPMGGRIHGDWCYPENLWRQMNFDLGSIKSE